LVGKEEKDQTFDIDTCLAEKIVVSKNIAEDDGSSIGI
jgi:hypothetical protein